MNNHKAIKEIRETYPKMIQITNGWLAHWLTRFRQSDEDKEVLMRFSEAMKQITKEDNGKGDKL